MMSDDVCGAGDGYSEDGSVYTDDSPGGNDSPDRRLLQALEREGTGPEAATARYARRKARRIARRKASIKRLCAVLFLLYVSILLTEALFSHFFGLGHLRVTNFTKTQIVPRIAALRNFPYGLTIVPILLLSLTVHELMHALVAYALGEEAMAAEGRLSLNPLRHCSPIGTLFLLVFGLGWAKPVQFDPDNLKAPKMDIALICAAGPLGNFSLAFVLSLVMYAFIRLGIYPHKIVAGALFDACLLNISLGVVNMLPIPPLDGSKVLMALLPDKLYDRMQDSWFPLILLGIGVVLLLVLNFGYSDFLYGSVIRTMMYSIFERMAP